MTSRRNRAAPSRTTEEPRVALGGFLLPAILAVVFLAFLPALRGGFVWDDSAYVVESEPIRSFGLQSIARMLLSPHQGNYHPLTMLSLALNYATSGLDPFGYHLLNLLLHVTNTFLVYRLVRSLSKPDAVAAVAAAFWGLHPLRVESVAWISGRKDLLYTAFFLAALLAYRRYAENRSPGSYLASVGSYLLSLLSKGMAVSLALVLPLSDFLDRRRLTKRSVLDKIPFLALSILFGLVAIWAQRHLGALEGDRGRSVLDRAILAGYALVAYLVKMVWPVRLSAYYPYPSAPGETLPLSYIVQATLVVPIFLGVLYSLRFTRKIAFGVLFYVATVLFVLQLLPVGGAVIADRYTYLSAVGLAYLVGEGFGVAGTAASRKGSAWWRVSWATCGIVLALLGVLTWKQCAVWHDDMALWNDVIRKNPDAHEAWRNRGVAKAAHGDKRGAIADFDEAIRLRPDYVAAYNSRGNARADLGDRDGARRDYEAAIRLRPDFAIGHYGLAYLAGEMGDFAKAAEGFSRALELDPGMIEARLNRGEAYLRIGRFEEALRDFDLALAQAPQNAAAYEGRARARLGLGDRPGARADAERAAAMGFPLDPALVEALRENSGGQDR